MLSNIVSRATSTAVRQGLLCVAVLWSGGWTTVVDAGTPTIAPRITTTTITLPAALETPNGNFCTWGFCASFGPRLYQAPMADGRTLIGWTDATGNGHVSRVNGATIEQTFDFAATPVRGLVVHPDNSFAVLLLNFATPPAAPAVPQNFMVLRLLTASGTTQWSTSLANSTAPIGVIPGAFPNPHTFADTSIGDSRLGYGGGMYGAYFSVFANPVASGTSHDGDQYTVVNDSGVIQTGGWNWGLSHSLAELIDYQPDLARLTAVGITDCFPSPALWADTTADGGPTHMIFAGDGDCSGGTGVQLGQMAAFTGGNWLVAFNAQSKAAFTDGLGNARANFTGQGVGVVSFNGTYTATPVTWLSTTDPTGVDEFDPVLARIGTNLASNRFLVGWRLQTEGTFNMGVIDPTGTILTPLEVVSPTAGWGNRDDSLKSRPDGSISWLEGAAGATTLQLFRYAETAPSHDFNGDRTSDIFWVNTTAGDMGIWTMKGGAFSSWSDLGTPPAGWTIVGTGDFNGDGITDILWSNTTTGHFGIWLMKSDAFSSWVDLGVPGAGWTVAGIGDFNDDGNSDILWRNTTTGDVGIWLMKAGAFSSWSDLGVPSAGYTIAGVGDFNGDGTSDILWTNTTTGDTGIWLMKGGAFSSWKDLGAPGTGYTVAGVGDFNGDGTSDILWTNTTTGDTGVWLIKGGAFSSWVDSGLPGAGWTVAGTGDYNGDGTTDILWRNTSGDTGIWIMSGGAFSLWKDLGVVPTTWTITP